MVLDLPKWEEVEADFRKFNDFYHTAQRLLRGPITQDTQRQLREYADWSYFPDMAKASGAWLRVNFPQEFSRILDVGKQVRLVLYDMADTTVSVNPGMAEGLLNALDAYSEMISDYLKQVAPADLTYQGFPVSNSQRLIDPIVRQTLDGLDFLVGLFKRRGVEKALQESVNGFSIVWDPQATHHGLYMQGNIYINVAKVQGKSGGRLWKNWLQEVFLHEFGHHVEAQLSREAQDVWKSAWTDIEEKRKVLDTKVGVAQADRARFFDLLAANRWNPSVASQKLSGLDKLKFGTWLRSPTLGEPFITPSRFRFTKRGLTFFGFFSDPEGTTLEEMGLSKGQDLSPEDRAYVTEQIERRSKRYRKILMLDNSYVMKITDELVDTLRKEDKSVDEALDKLGLPSSYARKDEGEDFAESFVAFMVNPSQLSDNAMFRMQQALSLSGLYGKSVMRLAAQVVKRYIEAGYLDIGDLILYGKFKNALGRITGFGKNEKGDPTVIIQPVDKEGNPKKSQPKELVMLKVRKVEPEAGKKKEAAMPSIAERVAHRYLTAAGIGLGKTWENGKVRIHRYSNSFEVVDLTNAGKRGKKVREMSIIPNKGHAENAAWMEGNSKYILLNASSYDSIKRFYEDILVDYPGEIIISEKDLRGIDVLPGTVRKIELQWKAGDNELDLTATPLDFQLKSSVPLNHPKTGDPVGRQDTSYWPAKKEDAKRFYAWLAGEGEGVIKRMNIQDLRQFWTSIDVKYDSH